MDAIEQMMIERASELEAITGGRVSVHCDLQKNHFDQWFRWFGTVTGGDFHDQFTMKNSFNELKSHFERCVNERNAMIAQKDAAEQSAQLYDVIYAGG